MPHKQAGTYTIAGKTYPSQYAYRKALAEQKGFESVPQYRTSRTAERFLERLGVRGNRAYDRTLEALSLMRKGESATRAAKRAGTTTQSIAKYGGKAVERQGRLLKATESDTLPRRMQMLMPDGIERNVIVRNSKEAQLLGRYANALKRYEQGDREALKPFEGKTVTVNGKKVPLVTDPNTIDTLTRAGVTSDWEPYERSLSYGG